MKLTLLLCVSAIIFMCAAQNVIQTEKSDIDICWQRDTLNPPGGRYIVMCKQYQTADTTWRYLSESNQNIANVQRPGYGKYIIGVAVVFNGDTSEISTSIDSSACLSGGCGDVCETIEPWIIWWRFGGPKYIRVKL